MHVLRSFDPIALPPPADCSSWVGSFCVSDDMEGCACIPAGGEVVVIAEPCPTCNGSEIAPDSIPPWPNAPDIGNDWTDEDRSSYQDWYDEHAEDCPTCSIAYACPTGFVVAGFATIEALPIRRAIRIRQMPDAVPGGVVIIPTRLPDRPKDMVRMEMQEASAAGHAMPSSSADTFVQAMIDDNRADIDKLIAEYELPAVGSPVQVDWHGKIGRTVAS